MLGWAGLGTGLGLGGGLGLGWAGVGLWPQGLGLGAGLGWALGWAGWLGRGGAGPATLKRKLVYLTTKRKLVYSKTERCVSPEKNELPHGQEQQAISIYFFLEGLGFRVAGVSGVTVSEARLRGSISVSLCWAYGFKSRLLNPGSLLDTILHFCYNTTLIFINMIIFHIAPTGNQNPKLHTRSSIWGESFTG